MAFVAVAIGAAVVAGAVKYAGARKNELKANDNHRKAKRESNAASAALAAAEAQSVVPGFGDSSNIPGYKRGTVSAITNTPNLSSNKKLAALQMAIQRNSDNRDRALGREIPQPTRGLGQPVLRDRFSGDDVGDRASGTVIADRGNPMARGFQEAIRRGDNLAGITRSQNLSNELLKRRFAEVTRTLPKTPAGLPIFPDPKTKEGKDFYAKLPKSIADMATNPAGVFGRVRVTSANLLFNNSLLKF